MIILAVVLVFAVVASGFFYYQSTQRMAVTGGPHYYKSAVTYQGLRPTDKISQAEAQELAQQGDAYYEVMYDEQGELLSVKKHYQGNAEEILYVEGQVTRGTPIAYGQKAELKSGIAGSWRWEEMWYEGEGNYSEINYFSLDLVLYDHTVQGQWFMGWRNSSRVNGCAEPEVCIRGTVNGNSAVVQFDQTYSGGTGEARITYDPKNETLLWEVIKKPEEEYYVPENALLQRVK